MEIEQPDPESMTSREDMRASALEAGNAKSYTFLGQPLNGFNSRREITAQSCGHRLLSGRVRMEGMTAYDGAFFDIALVIWLCTLDDDQVDEALSDPTAARIALLDWAEEIGFTIGSEPFTEALSIHFDIASTIFARQLASGESAHAAPAETAARKSSHAPGSVRRTPVRRQSGK